MTDFGPLFTRLTEPYPSPDQEAVEKAMKAFRGHTPATAEREATVKFLRSWSDSAKDQIVYAIRHDTNENLLELAHEACTAEILADSIETGEHLHE